MDENSLLASRLKNKLKEEQEIIQSLTTKELENLRAELMSIYKDELATIEADMKHQNEKLGWKLLKTRMIWPSVTAFSLCIGIFSGSWGMVQYYTREVFKLQRKVDLLEKRGGKIKLTECGEKKRLCAMIETKAETYRNKNKDTYMILKGY